MGRIARMLCRVLGHRDGVRWERHVAGMLIVGHACPRCLVVLDMEGGTRRARRRARFGR